MRLELFVYEGCGSRRVVGNPRNASALRMAQLFWWVTVGEEDGDEQA